MTWGSEAQAVAEKAAKSGFFIKLENKGESVTVVFLGEPVTYNDDFKGKVTSKILFELWDVEQGCRRVFDVNAKHTNAWWDEIKDAGGPFHQFKITKTGTGMETAYDLRAKPRGEVPPAMKGAIEGSDAIDLNEIRNKKNIGGAKGGRSKYDDPGTDAPPQGEVPHQDDDIPF